MNSVYISLGSNLGNREANLQKSTDLLNKTAGEIAASSSLYETEPWNMNDAASFINQVVLLKTNLSAGKLMNVLVETETRLGRVRLPQIPLKKDESELLLAPKGVTYESELPQTPKGALTTKYESRIIDIDILFFNDSIISSGKLTVPHPLLHQRRFVLEPLAEINPGFVHPALKLTIARLLAECGDSYRVTKMVSK